MYIVTSKDCKCVPGSFIYIFIYFFKLAFVLFLFVLLLQYLNFFGTKITENVPDCNVYYVLFWYPDKTYVRDFSEVYKFSYKRGLRSWRFCCVSQSKSYSRAKAESRTKMKTMGEGARGEDTFSFCAAESRDLLQVDFSYSSQVLKSERSKSLGITNQDKKNRTLESLLNLLLYESQTKKHTKKTPS